MSEGSGHQTALTSAVGSNSGQPSSEKCGSGQRGQPSSEKCGVEGHSDCSSTAPRSLGESVVCGTPGHSAVTTFQPHGGSECGQVDDDGGRGKSSGVRLASSVNTAMCEENGEACRAPCTSEPALVLEASSILCGSAQEEQDCEQPSSLRPVDAERHHIFLSTKPNSDLDSDLHPSCNSRSSTEDEEDVDQHSCTVQIDVKRRDISLGVKQERGSRGDCCEEHHGQRTEDFSRCVGNSPTAAVCEGEGHTAPGTDHWDKGPLRTTSDDDTNTLLRSAVWGGGGLSTSFLLGREDVRGIFGGGGHDVCVRIKQEPPDDHPPQTQPEHRHTQLSHMSHLVPSHGLTVSPHRIKREPGVDDGGGLDRCSEESRTNSRLRDVVSGHCSVYTSCPDRTHPGNHTPGQAAHHTHMRNVYVSFASASKKMKCEFPGMNSRHAFKENGQKMYGSAADHAATSSVDCQEKTDFSDESDCETLPVHFESPRRGLGNDSDYDTLPVHFEAPQRGLGEEMLYECGMCQIAFSLPAQCHEHVIQHEASDRCYVCGSCKASFQQISLLTQHVSVHTFSEGSELHYDNPKAFVCHVCSKVFRRLYELNRHQTIHSGNKPFVCDVCHKTFARGDELNRHIRVHSGIKPFACEDCSRAFITKHELNQHKKSHSEHKPFTCPICSRGFLRADKLFHHQQMHAGDRPYECEVCHKGFITQSELRQHQKIHTGVKPFACEVCCKAYLKVNDLNRHMKMHTGQKPFTCDVCGKAFHRTDILSRHKKIHTRTKLVRRGRPPSRPVALHSLTQASAT